MNDNVLGIADLLAENISGEESRRVGFQLTDARQRLLEIIRERVAHNDVDSLSKLCNGRYACHKILDHIETRLTRIRELTGEPFNGNEVAPIHAARALASLGLVLVAGPEHASIHFPTFRRWIRCSGLEVPGEQVRKIPTIIDTPHASVMRFLADAGDLDLLSLVWMTELDGWVRQGRSEAVRPGPGIQVLLDRGRQGQNAVLSLSRAPGLPAGLIPDPATMTLSSADVKFQSSLATAWKVAGGSSRGAVLWSLGDKTGPVTRVTDESLSLGFTALFDEQRRLARPLLGLLTVRRLRPRTAIVGRIDEDAPDAASSVSGYDAKLSVVDENTRVVVPHVDYRAAVDANHKYGDNAQLVPVKTWRQAATAGRAVDRRRLLMISVVILLILGSAMFGLYRVTEARRDAASRAAMADAAARALLERSTDSRWERLQLDLHAYRTHDGLDTRNRIRAWAQQLRFAETMIPIDDTATDINADGSAAVTPNPTESDRLLAWDFTTSPPTKFSADADGNGPTVAAWLGRDVVAVSRSHGKTALWNVRTQQRVRELDAGGDELVGDPTGRWLGYGSLGANEFRVLDLQRGTVDTVRLPGPLQHWGLRQGMLHPNVVVEGILTSGELVVAYSDRVIALSRAGFHPLDDRAYLAQVVDLGQGQAVVERNTHGEYQLFGLESSTVLATHSTPDGSNEDIPVRFTPDLRQAITVESVPAPRGRPEPESYVVLGTDSDTKLARRVEIPAGYHLARAATETSGAYRLILESADSLLVLRVLPPDAMEEALIQAQDAVVTNDERFLVLRGDENRVESWDIGARRLVSITAPGSSELSQEGSKASLVISPDSSTLVTVFHNRPAKVWRLPDLQSLGEIPLPAASQAFIDGVEEEIGATASFVSDRILQVGYGDGLSTWSLAPLAKRTVAQIPLPDADAPGEWRVVMPGFQQLLTVRGNHVQRNQLSDGALVSGSAFSLGDSASRDFQGFRPVVDPSGTLIAVFHGDAIEIWDLLEHRRVDRRPLADYTGVDHIRFIDDTNEIEFALMDYRSKNTTGIVTQRWHRSRGFDVLDWLGLGGTEIEQVPDKIPSTFAAWPGTDATLEPVTPLAWMDQICQTLPDMKYKDLMALPEASWRGDVCANR
ncbi:hypothetical protein [Amycolatopsis sp. NPDC051128]|uniref:hypothetical protein n=1 Tax=Amycolatopsis sp. NPDC051128 TaxID=3155412 RepID=UPI00342059AE